MVAVEAEEAAVAPAAAQVPAGEQAPVREQAREPEQAPGLDRAQALAPEEVAAEAVRRRCRHCEQFERPAFADSRRSASGLLARVCQS